MSKPLEGIRVLDLSNVLSGPFCCHQMAHLGAEVIKVEVAGRGDLARNLGADSNLNARGMGVSFLAQNAGKKSVTVNLKCSEGKSLFLRLVETADVVVENFRPSVMKRLGIGYEVLKEVNGSIIYCSISGFGREGPWKDRPAYDQIIQGCSGLMGITGDEDSGPLRVGYPVADTVGGMTAAFAIASALNGSPRGAFIDVSMLESLLATMGWVVSNYLVAGLEPHANGNENMTSSPSGSFETRRGLINIAANKDEHWVLLTDYLGLSGLRERSEYLTREDRKKNRLSLKSELEVVLKTRPACEWVEELNRIDVPSGAVLTVAEVLEMPQVADRGFLHEFKNVPGVGEDIKVVTTGIKIDGESPLVETPPPLLGEHNDEVWGKLGVSRERLEALREDGII